METPTLPTTPVLPPGFRMPECAAHDAKVIFEGEYDILLATPPTTVLDIGANVGLFTIWAAQRWPDCSITAYEPWPANFIDLSHNVSEHACGRSRSASSVTLIQGALGALEGKEWMREGRNRMRCSKWATEGLQESVQQFDAALVPSAEFVKINVEGHELIILERLDLSATRAVAVEAHSEQLAYQIVRLLRERGFTCLSASATDDGCSLLKFAREQEPLLPSAKKIFVGLAVYSGYHPLFIASLLHLLQAPPCAISVKQWPGDSLVCRARNVLAAQFLQTDCTHLLFLDTDLIFSTEQIAHLVSHDELIVAGFYPKKQKVLDWVLNTIEGETPDERGLQRVKYAGTGCLLIAREVFERMIEAHPEIEFTPDREVGVKHWDFFSVGVYHYPDGTRRYLSEDWYFCQRALDLGIPVHADARVELKHVGDFVYPLEDPLQESVPRADAGGTERGTTD
jgi:FkbM family methyltransferase